MSATVLLASLVVSQARDYILGKLFDAAASVGLDVESFASGDPTRSTMFAVATQLETYEATATGAIKGGFLDTAEEDWLSIKMASDFNTPRQLATYAECTLRLTHGGATGVYAIDPDDVTFASSGSGATYRNSTGGTLTPGNTLDVTVIAEIAGADSSAAIGEIDSIVSPAMANVTVSNTTAAVGLDKESDTAGRSRARAKLASLSPNGPAAAYDYVARTRDLNGGANVTKTRVLADSVLGEVTVYLAGPSGAVSGGDVALVQDAFSTYCEPLTIQATAVSASNMTQAVTYALYVYDSLNKTSAEIEDDVEAALLAGFALRPISGDDGGKLYKGWIEATILAAVAPHGFRCSVTTPAADVTMTAGQVAVLGVVTPTVNIIGAP